MIYAPRLSVSHQDKHGSRADESRLGITSSILVGVFFTPVASQDGGGLYSQADKAQAKQARTVTSSTVPATEAPVVRLGNRAADDLSGSRAKELTGGQSGTPEAGTQGRGQI